jgi:D-beta-D-heptose 7-phosphate kinase/D-beta-D-heptose 1-phosphate adenosyltransferase
MKENFIDIIESFKALKALVIGDAVLDTYIITKAEKFCREAPVPVFNVYDYKQQCGGAANTAMNVAALGATTYFLSVVGRDENAKHLCGQFKKNKINTDYIIKDKSRATVAKKRVTASANILFRLDEGTTSSISEQHETELLKNISDIITDMNVIIISDYETGLFTDTFIRELKSILLLHDVPLIVDAKNISKFKSLNPTAVKPNYEEAVNALQIEKKNGEARISQLAEQEKKYFEISGASIIASTLDANGVLFFEKNKTAFHLACTPQNDKNSIGAGDTFTAALALSIAAKATTKTIAELACAAAFVVMQKDETAGCSNYELKQYFNPTPKYIFNEEELIKLVQHLRHQNKKIVFTNGCFDILHKGHISLLNNACKAGDVLIVGVNSDASIKKLKGNNRPINTLEDRITVLAGLQSVHYLVSFDEESPLHLIKIIHPDVFVKGGNYTKDSIPEAPLLKKINCTVQILPYLEEHFTTHIIDKIRYMQKTNVAMPA